MPDERQRDYSLFFGTVAADTILPAQQFKTDTDGPFCLREIGLTGTGGALIESLTLRFLDPVGRFIEQNFVVSLGEIPYPGNGPVLTPVIPQMIYPPNSNIVVYLNNLNPSASIQNLRMVFRGSTLHPTGTILNRASYPAYFREVPFAYVIPFTMPSLVSRDNIINIQSDADFACRAGLLTATSPIAGAEWFIAFKDQNGKYYEVPFLTNTQTQEAVFPDTILGRAEPSRPGLFVPEFYMRRNSSLYFDIQGPSEGTFKLRLIGSKIYESQMPC